MPELTDERCFGCGGRPHPERGWAMKEPGFPVHWLCVNCLDAIHAGTYRIEWAADGTPTLHRREVLVGA